MLIQLKINHVVMIVIGSINQILLSLDPFNATALNRLNLIDFKWYPSPRIEPASEIATNSSGLITLIRTQFRNEKSSSATGGTKFQLKIGYTRFELETGLD